ncbi:MAG: LuxR C-terminal-related transcriptional regulator [Candidatus Korobacteraceae bacterium]
MEPRHSGNLPALLDPLYDAALQPELWKVFLQKVSEALRADKVAILVVSPGRQRTDIHADLGFSNEMRHDVEELATISPWLVEIEKHRSVGWYVGRTQDELSMESFRKSKFYLEALHKHNVEWSAAAVLFMPGGAMHGLVTSRPKTGRPFSAIDKELLKQLVPHLRRAFNIHGTTAALRHCNAASQSALDLVGAACIFLDANGRVLSTSRRAEALIADAATLRIRNHRLLTSLSVEQNALEACVLPACACGAGKSSDPGAGAIVLHTSHGTPLYISVLPCHSSRAFLGNNPAALLFITTPEQQGRGEHRLWQSMFGLSPAECRVAEMMKQGMEVAEISEAIRIKVDTVRYYQKCIYRKTSVRGQGQLMRLLTRLPSSLP